MQRFRITGIYLAGVVVIIASAVWGVSLRRPPKANAARLSLSISAANQPPQSGGAESIRSSGTAPTEVAGVAKVSIDNFLFVPEELTVMAGTTVTWMNRDDVPHTVSSTSKPSAFDSKALDTDDTYSFQFKTPGSYDYYCKVHPQMIGRIIVK